MSTQVNFRIDDKLLSELDELVDRGEFESRGSAIRYAIRKMLRDGGRKL